MQWLLYLFKFLIERIFLSMNLSPPRKPNIKEKDPTTDLNTPPHDTKTKEQISESSDDKQCPYHFGHYTHICLTCRKSICPRCATTSCKYHIIHPYIQVIQQLTNDLQKLTINPLIQYLQLILKQSKQRQQYIEKKIQKILIQIQQHFEHTRYLLQKKKQQIVRYYAEGIIQQWKLGYHHHDEVIAAKLDWLRNLQTGDACDKCSSIEQLDNLTEQIKKEIPINEPINKIEKDIIEMHSFWSEQKLQQVLYQIENISYKVQTDHFKRSPRKTKKKNITQHSLNHKNRKNRKIDKAMFFSPSNKNLFRDIIIK